MPGLAYDEDTELERDEDVDTELAYHDKKYPVSVIVRMTEAQRAKLKARAQGLGISMAEVIRNTIGK